MLDTIRFLEAMGANPIPESDYAVAVAGLEIEELQRAALLGRNHGALNDLLGGRAKMFFGVLAPDEGPLDEPFEDRPDDTPAEPDQDE